MDEYQKLLSLVIDQTASNNFAHIRMAKLGMKEKPVIIVMKAGMSTPSMKGVTRLLRSRLLKRFKDLVEKMPLVIKKGVSKEEGEQIVEKLKALGAKVAIE
ncbi:hypothetical protein EJ110_NYTH34687 [Nymphaea thermarum]|nr:hypothetical protein EJ110_NYTH34687 [Nymphaea thermarum]